MTLSITQGYLATKKTSGFRGAQEHKVLDKLKMLEINNQIKFTIKLKKINFGSRKFLTDRGILAYI